MQFKKIIRHFKKDVHGMRYLAFGGLFCFIVVGVSLSSIWIGEQPAEEVRSAQDSFELGERHFNQGGDTPELYNLKKARTYYEEAIEIDPKANEFLWYQLGRIDFLESKFDDALVKFDTQIKYFGDSVPSVYYMIGLTNGFKAKETGNSEDWKKGEDAFLKFLELKPESPWARVDLSWIYFAQGKFEEMVPLLKEAIDSDPEEPWVQNMYGLALLNTGKKEEARAHFELAYAQAMELTPKDWGDSYPGNHPDDWDDGLRSFQEAIQKNIALTENTSGE